MFRLATVLDMVLHGAAIWAMTTSRSTRSIHPRKQMKHDCVVQLILMCTMRDENEVIRWSGRGADSNIPGHVKTPSVLTDLENEQTCDSTPDRTDRMQNWRYIQVSVQLLSSVRAASLRVQLASASHHDSIASSRPCHRPMISWSCWIAAPAWILLLQIWRVNRK